MSDGANGEWSPTTQEPKGDAPEVPTTDPGATSVGDGAAPQTAAPRQSYASYKPGVYRRAAQAQRHSQWAPRPTRFQTPVTGPAPSAQAAATEPNPGAPASSTSPVPPPARSTMPPAATNAGFSAANTAAFAGAESSGSADYGTTGTSGTTGTEATARFRSPYESAATQNSSPAPTPFVRAAGGAGTQTGSVGAYPQYSGTGSTGAGGTGFPGGPSGPNGPGGPNIPGTQVFPSGFQPDPQPPVTQKTKSGPGWIALFAAMLVTGLFTGSLTMGLIEYRSDSGTTTSSTEEVTPGTDLQSGTEVIPPVITDANAADWEAVAEAVRPVTVAIMVEGPSGAASGSGVIFDSEGHIITNYHVVSAALTEGTVTVTTQDGRLFNATIVGTDSTTDLAVLALTNPPSDLVAARFATSETLMVGQPIMAIGAPLGLADTVTTGVISALDRPVTVEASGAVDPADPFSQNQTELVVTNAIQVDASLNPGNSGGPLFDAEGGVIGINSSIASNSSSADEAGSIGLGFAIPVDLVKSVAEQIITNGVVQHALLGVEIRTGTGASGEATYLGAEVVTVSSGGAAEAAGLQPGDVIIGIDGHSVTSGASLTGYVRRYTAGQQVTLEVLRGGQEVSVDAVLQAKTS